MREYGVWVWSSTRTDEVIKYEVAQSSNGKQCSPVAVFPVCSRYDADVQKKRAHDYCGYMNKLVEAEKVAYEQNQLVNILKA